MKKTLLYIFFSCFATFGWCADSRYPAIVHIASLDGNEEVEYRYANDGKRVMEMRRQWENDVYINTKQTEWVYVNDVCVEINVKDWNIDKYINSTQTLYEYNSVNLPIRKTTQGWGNNNWENDEQELISYEENKQIMVKSFWDGEQWVNQTKTECTYTNDQLASLTSIVWQAGVWTNSQQVLFEYTKDGQASKEELHSWDTQKANWVGEVHTLYFYNNNQQLLREEKQRWSASLQNWIGWQRIDYEYNEAGEIATQTHAAWDVSFWKNNLRLENTYDNRGNLTIKETFYWTYNMWLPAVTEFFTYDAKNNRLSAESIAEYWAMTYETEFPQHLSMSYNNRQNTDIYYGHKVDIVYDELSNLSGTNSIILDKINHPFVKQNPSYDGLFHVESPNTVIAAWKVYSLDGKELKAEQGNDASYAVVDLRQYKSGMYILAVVCNNNTYTIKLIKQ